MVFLMVQRFMKLQRKYRHIDGNDYFPLVVGIISAIDGHSQIFIYFRVYRSVLNFAHSFLFMADPKVYFKLAWKNFDEHWLLFFFNLNISKNLTCPSGQLRTEFACQWQVLP